MKEAVIERTKERIWTYEDYLRLEDEKRYEVINGRLEEMPAPTTEHQIISKRLFLLIEKFVSEGNLGLALYAPVDVVLSKTTVVQPDILFVSGGRKNIVKERIYGPPDLVVEIVSSTSYVKDRYEKFKLYEKHGVKEYWIVLPGEKVIEVWCLKDGKYVLHSVAVEKGEVESCVLKGLKVEVESVLK